MRRFISIRLDVHSPIHHQLYRRLEPNRALLRSYLGKAFSQVGDTARAAKELELAKRLDLNDPTAWLYSDFWQCNAFVGYRFPGRRAEFSLGVLNLIDLDYRLNPLTLYSELPRKRTAVVSFKFYF